MAVISSFDTTTLQGLVTTLSNSVNVLAAPLSEFSVAERLKRLESANRALAALNAYITSIT